jgi:hypothetical protein
LWWWSTFIWFLFHLEIQHGQLCFLDWLKFKKKSFEKPHVGWNCYMVEVFFISWLFKSFRFLLLIAILPRGNAFFCNRTLLEKYLKLSFFETSEPFGRKLGWNISLMNHYKVLS